MLSGCLCGPAVQAHNLLGLPAIRALGLLSQADKIMVELEEIHLRPDAHPFALHTPHNVSLSLCKKVKDELKTMESLGVTCQPHGVLGWSWYQSRMAPCASA